MAPTALKKKQTVVEAAPVVVDEREGLTNAIHAHFGARCALEAKEAAISRCRANIDEAESRLEAATKFVDKARQKDADKAAVAIATGREITASHTQRAERAVEEAQRLIEVSAGARKRLGQDLAELKDDLADAQNAITVVIRHLVAPLIREVTARLADARRRCAVDVRILSELLDEDLRVAPFVDQMRESNARMLREAVFADLKVEAARPLFGASDHDHELGLQASKEVKAALLALRSSSAAPLPKV